MIAPPVYVRITNPSHDPAMRLVVQTLRQDIAPGEPGSLSAQITACAGEDLLLELPFGAALVVTVEGDAHARR